MHSMLSRGCARSLVLRGLVALALALALALAACSRTSGGTVPFSQGATTPPAFTASPTPGTADSVILLPAAAHFAGSATVTITVRNDTPHAIYAQPHATACTVIALQRLSGRSWQQAFPCVNGFPHPTSTGVAPGDAVAVQIAPTTVGGGADPDGDGRWPAGTYRAALTYTTNPSAGYGAGTTVY